MLILPLFAIVAGLVVLVWSADRFVDGAVGVARFCGMSTLLIGMVVVGFGTSAPEMVVSAFAAMENSPQLALGNAYGSNVANIALILGVTALISPVLVRRRILKKDLPVLIAVSLLSLFLVSDGSVSRWDALALMLVFALVMGVDIWIALRNRQPERVAEAESNEKPVSFSRSVLWLVAGLLLLVGSSRLLVWGAVEVARSLGVSDLLIGLTIVAVGTSLPELASSIAAARRHEHDLVLGNIIGSNLFNTLVVVGIAGLIAPMNSVDPNVFSRDIPIMTALTAFLLVLGFRFQGEGRINRVAGGLLLVFYVCYVALLIVQATLK